jgi:hypothetical protein
MQPGLNGLVATARHLVDQIDLRGSTCTAHANPSRTSMPEEVELAPPVSMKSSSSANGTMSS